MSEAYHSRPSELMHISNQLFGFYLDRAIFFFGSMVDADIDEATQKAKNERQRKVKVNMIHMRWGIMERQYRDPAAR